ncbi:hypothetical protein BC829DRAFT_67512 [Chytridium lagenaria]|nr:hypothetical protein BC829DRAFT_67512 [Chytridium lagenaria]
MAPRKSKPVRTTRAVNSISNNLIASPSLSSFSSSASAASHYIASSPTPSLTHSSWSISSDDAPGIIFSLGFAAVPSHDLKSSSSSSSSIVTPHTSINTTTTTTANNALALKISTNTTTLSNTSPCTPPSTAPCSPSHSSRSKSDLAVSFTPYRPTTPSTDVDSPPLPTNTTAAQQQQQQVLHPQVQAPR